MAIDYSFDKKAGEVKEGEPQVTTYSTPPVPSVTNPQGEKLVPVTVREQEVRYLTEQEAARERLKASVDALAQQASLQAKMQQEPLKMIGGASAVGAVLGMVVGRQFRRSKKIYVDADSPAKHQKALVKAQKQSKGQDVGGALVATLGTLAFKMLMDKVVTPKLEEVAGGLLDRAGQPRPAGQAGSAGQSRVLPVRVRSVAVEHISVKPNGVVVDSGSASRAGGVSSFLKPVHPGVVPMPESKVEAKAVGTPISEEERHNPNES